MADQPQDEGAHDGGGPGDGSPEEIPLGQRLFDSPFLLLAACLVVMFVFFTGWGLVEIFTMPQAPLP